MNAQPLRGMYKSITEHSIQGRIGIFDQSQSITQLLIHLGSGKDKEVK